MLLINFNWLLDCSRLSFRSRRSPSLSLNGQSAQPLLVMRPAIFSISLPIRGENAKMFVKTWMVKIRVRCWFTLDLLVPELRGPFHWPDSRRWWLNQLVCYSRYHRTNWEYTKFKLIILYSSVPLRVQIQRFSNWASFYWSVKWA